jgi:hypothetical protein
VMVITRRLARVLEVTAVQITAHSAFTLLDPSQQELVDSSRLHLLPSVVRRISSLAGHAIGVHFGRPGEDKKGP